MHIVLLAGDGLDLGFLYPVMEHLTLVIKEERGNECLAGFLFLLFNHGVEAADGAPIQPLYGAATVQNEHQLRQALIHNSKTTVSVTAAKSFIILDIFILKSTVYKKQEEN